MKNLILETVSVLLRFVKDYDFYAFYDADIDAEEQTLTKALETGDVEPIREHLLSYAEESEDAELVEAAYELVRRLDVISFLQKKGGLCYA